MCRPESIQENQCSDILIQCSDILNSPHTDVYFPIHGRSPQIHTTIYVQKNSWYSINNGPHKQIITKQIILRYSLQKSVGPCLMPCVSILTLQTHSEQARKTTPHQLRKILTKEFMRKFTLQCVACPISTSKSHTLPNQRHIGRQITSTILQSYSVPSLSAKFSQSSSEKSRNERKGHIRGGTAVVKC